MLHFLFISCIAAFTATHPIHLGITEVQYAEKEKSLQVVHKLFVDDLESHIEKQEQAAGKTVRLFLNTEKEHPEANRYIQEYLNQHFQIKVNGKMLQGKFLGKEYENGASWLYVEYPNVPRPKQLYISGNALIGLHEDQNNIINLDINGKKGSLRFYKGYDRDQINF